MDFHTFLWMILGGVFASTVLIVVVFIMINKCMKRKAAKYVATSENHTKSSYQSSSSYKQNGQENIPPLPSRAQFEQESMSNSYEDIPDIPMVAVETSPLKNPDNSHFPETHINFLDNPSLSESYDDVDALPKVKGSYEEVASLPDYLEVDLPPFQTESDNGSENYDDVDQLHVDDEDYDDVV